MTVPLLDLRAQYTPLKTEIERALGEVCANQRFILGPSVTELERRIAEYSGAGFGVGVSSGTDALLLALMALDIGAGDEVLTTPFTFFATAGVVARLGARPVFCDIDPHTYNMSAEAAASVIEERFERREGALVNRHTGGRLKALLPVHLYGQMADMDAFVALAREHGLALVEDAAQAIGAADARGRKAGSIGDIGCFSFFPTKNLGAFGDAGMCVTSDPSLAERMRILRVHGGEPKYYHELVGGNFRLDELQAAVLLVKLPHLEAWSEGRRANAAHYDALLAHVPGTTPPYRLPGCRHIFNQYVVRSTARDRLREHLQAAGIGTEIYYPVPLHRQRCFAYLGYDPGAFPEAEKASAEVLALPIYPELTHEQRAYVAQSIAHLPL